MFVWGILKRGIPELVRFCIGDHPIVTTVFIRIYDDRWGFHSIKNLHWLKPL